MRVNAFWVIRRVYAAEPFKERRVQLSPTNHLVHLRTRILQFTS